MVLRGARQVGKSTIVREFAREYDHFVELNLERKEDHRLFELENVRDIIESAFVRENVPLKSGSVLLFIDEIQESPKAIRNLRFFYEDFPELHVICAGSLLEHVIRDIPSFPVGRIQQMIIHPFDFEEFLWAKGNEQLSRFFAEIPVRQHLHPILLGLFNEYTVIGGMPEVVKTYIQSGSFTGLKDVYDEIWLTYKEDIEK
ncbi:MAG: AAA family ATPase [Bacteroidia bacterium]|nr:AAA family ATPase [Bacteroidia bacterium]